MTRFVDLLLKLHSAGMGHEAAIEIMIALLGLMLTTLALVAAVLGVLGFSIIKREVKKRATEVARTAASSEARRQFAAERDRAQAEALAVAQAEELPKAPQIRKKRSPAARVRATNDKNLKKGSLRDDQAADRQ